MAKTNRAPMGAWADDPLTTPGVGGGDPLAPPTDYAPNLERPQQQPQEDQSLGFTDYLQDIGIGAANGSLGFVQSLLDLGIDVANIPAWLLTQRFDTIGHGEEWKVGNTRTFAGGLVDGIVQFSLGMLISTRILTAATKLPAAGKLIGTLMKSQMGANLAKGAVADFISFNEHEERLSNLIQEYPMLANPISEWLAADGEDNWLTGRLKNSMEGLGLGYLTDAFLPSLKGYKAGRKVLAEGGTEEEAVKAMAKELGDPEAVEALLKKAQGTDLAVVDDVARAADDAAQAGAEGGAKKLPGKVQKFEDYIDTETGTKKQRPKQKPGLEPTFDIEDYAKSLADSINSGEPVDYAVRKVAINFTKMGDPETVYKTTEAIAKSAMGKIRDPNTDVMTFKEVKNLFSMFDIEVGPLDFVKALDDKTKSLPVDMLQARFIMEGGALGVADSAVATMGRNYTPQSLADLRKIWIDNLTYQKHFFNAKANTARATTFQRIDNAELAEVLQKKANRKARPAQPTAITPFQSASTKTISKIDAMLTKAQTMTDTELIEMVPYIAMTKGDPAKMMELMKVSTLPKRLLKAHNELWINGVLGSPKSLAVDNMSMLYQTVFVPFERALGGAISGNKQVVREAMLHYSGLKHQVFDTLKLASMADKIPQVGTAGEAAWKALRKGGNVLDPHGLALERSNSRAISSKAFNKGRYVLNEATGRPEWQASGLGKAIDFLGSIVNIPTKLRVGGDELYRQINYRARVEAKAISDAFEKGLKEGTPEFSEFVVTRFRKAFNVEELAASAQFEAARLADRAGLARGTPEFDSFVGNKFNKLFDPGSAQGMDKEALQFSREISFAQDLEYGIGKSLQQLAMKHPALAPLIPFIKTPTNIIRGFWARTPGLQLAQKQFRDDLISGDPIRYAKAKGQQATGTLLWVGGIMLANEGKITGSGPTQPDVRRAWLAAGNQPYSIRIGDKFIQYSRLDPLGMFLGMSADFASISGGTNEEESNQAAMAMVAALAKNLGNKTYLMGLTDALNAFTEPDKELERWWQSRVGSYVPSLVTQVGKEITEDTALKDVRSWLDAIMARTPGLSDKVAPRRNIFGEVVNAPTALGPDVLSPFAMTKKLNDKVKDEMAALGHGFSMPRESINGMNLRNFKNSKGQDAYDRWLEIHGEIKINGQGLHEALNKLIESKRYQRLPNFSEEDSEFKNPRVREIQRVLGWYRSKAWEQLMREYPDLQGKQAEFHRNQRIAQLKGLEALQ